MVEIVRRSTVVPDRVLELSEIVERGDLFQVDLESRATCQNGIFVHARRRSGNGCDVFSIIRSETHVVVLLEIVEILHLILS